ncbi:MAG TPA: RNA 3'-terminal phosphate cyclase [Burkholderiales bacterium]|nr:RNA 3'-terminal phosphate cyclase [Burkholderiales bacterium]
MREIDGSYGEGGGQLLRTACALSAITGEAIRLRDIRRRRTPPGLAPQHLMAVKAVAALCGAEVEGLDLRSPSIVFRPGAIRGGEFRFDVGTAGSLTLVLQALVPVALAAATPTRIHLTGGTDIRAAPPLDYFRFVLMPLLARMGARVQVDLIRRGYYPRGGGQLMVTVAPSALEPLRLEAVEPVAEISGRVHVANLPEHIAMRMHETAARLLGDIAPVHIAQELADRARAVGSGGAIVLWARGANILLGGGEVAQRGIPAERIAATAAGALREDIVAGATIDRHAADQLPVYAARAKGRSSFLVRALSTHAQTALWLLPQFLPLRAHLSPSGDCTRVDIDPGGHRSGA